MYENFKKNIRNEFIYQFNILCACCVVGEDE